jgi:hypothetical protein
MPEVHLVEVWLLLGSWGVLWEWVIPVGDKCAKAELVKQLIKLARGPKCIGRFHHNGHWLVVPEREDSIPNHCVWDLGEGTVDQCKFKLATVREFPGEDLLNGFVQL